MGMQREFPNMRLDYLKAHPTLDMIAAVGSRSCIVLSTSLEILQRHLDANRNEKFYCCEFISVQATDLVVSHGKRHSQTAVPVYTSANSRDTGECLTDTSGMRHFICIAGETGIIKILDLNLGQTIGYLKGHTGAIYDLKAYNNTLISSSEDSTVRLWNVSKLACIGVIGGILCHRDSVLTVDYHPSGTRLVSAGVDNKIRQWAVDFGADEYMLVQEPLLTFSGIHGAAVHKVVYYGDIILSLCNNVVVALYSNRDLSMLRTEESDACGCVFQPENPVLIGSVDFYRNCKTFAVVNHVLIGLSTHGDIYLYDLSALSKERTPYVVDSGLSGAEDFVVVGRYIYISTGSAIHRLPLDLSRFEEK